MASNQTLQTRWGNITFTNGRPNGRVTYQIYHKLAMWQHIIRHGLTNDTCCENFTELATQLKLHQLEDNARVYMVTSIKKSLQDKIRYLRAKGIEACYEAQDGIPIRRFPTFTRHWLRPDWTGYPILDPTWEPSREELRAEANTEILTELSSVPAAISPELQYRPDTQPAPQTDYQPSRRPPAPQRNYIHTQPQVHYLPAHLRANGPPPNPQSNVSASNSTSYQQERHYQPHPKAQPPMGPPVSNFQFQTPYQTHSFDHHPDTPTTDAPPLCLPENTMVEARPPNVVSNNPPSIPPKVPVYQPAWQTLKAPTEEETSRVKSSKLQDDIAVMTKELSEGLEELNRERAKMRQEESDRQERERQEHEASERARMEKQKEDEAEARRQQEAAEDDRRRFEKAKARDQEAKPRRRQEAAEGAEAARRGSEEAEARHRENRERREREEQSRRQEEETQRLREEKQAPQQKLVELQPLSFLKESQPPAQQDGVPGRQAPLPPCRILFPAASSSTARPILGPRLQTTDPTPLTRNHDPFHTPEDGIRSENLRGLSNQERNIPNGPSESSQLRMHVSESASESFHSAHKEKAPEHPVSQSTMRLQIPVLEHHLSVVQRAMRSALNVSVRMRELEASDPSLMLGMECEWNLQYNNLIRRQDDYLMEATLSRYEFELQHNAWIGYPRTNQQVWQSCLFLGSAMSPDFGRRWMRNVEI